MTSQPEKTTEPKKSAEPTGSRACVDEEKNGGAAVEERSSPRLVGCRDVHKDVRSDVKVVCVGLGGSGLGLAVSPPRRRLLLARSAGLCFIIFSPARPPPAALGSIAREARARPKWCNEKW